MEKKLYRVEVVLYVMAEDELNARLAATQTRFDFFECTAEEAKKIDSGWEDAVPYNADDDCTCAEIITRKTETAHPEAKTLPPDFTGFRRSESTHRGRLAAQSDLLN